MRMIECATLVNHIHYEIKFMKMHALFQFLFKIVASCSARRFRGDRGGRTRYVLRPRLSKRTRGFGISDIMAFFGQCSEARGSACGGVKRRSLRNLDPFGGRARSEASSRVDNPASGDDRFLSQKWESHALSSCRASPFSVREHFGSNSAFRRLRDARRAGVNATTISAQREEAQSNYFYLYCSMSAIPRTRSVLHFRNALRKMLRLSIA